MSTTIQVIDFQYFYKLKYFIVCQFCSFSSFLTRIMPIKPKLVCKLCSFDSLLFFNQNYANNLTSSLLYASFIHYKLELSVTLFDLRKTNCNINSTSSIIVCLPFTCIYMECHSTWLQHG